MKTKDQLKEIIVDLRLELVEKDLPRGVCPYALFRLKNMQKRRSDCMKTDCDVCHREFLELYRQEVADEVKRW